ncbi:hypothetical protein BASA60_003165 [Batrachochytrium salamandrivorans]|nr:hypothetical protein BASA60_003165 [Batrachochytrium salamandrivorans]
MFEPPDYRQSDQWTTTLLWQCDPGGGSGGDDKDPFCDPIVSKLSGLRDEAVALSYNIPRHRQISYRLRGYRRKDPDRDEYGFIKLDRMVARSELDDEDSPELKEIKKDLMALEGEYRELWIPFINKCWAKSFDVLSPEKMIEQWLFFRRTKMITLETWAAPPYQ